MKRPGLFTALAAATPLCLVLSGPAKSYSTDYTTADPNPSGYTTCAGVNANGSTATWTVGGVISFTSDYMSPPRTIPVAITTSMRRHRPAPDVIIRW